MKPCTERIYNGVIKENPTLVLMLGMCPTLGGYHLLYERIRNGRIHAGGTGDVQSGHLRASEGDTWMRYVCRLISSS